MSALLDHLDGEIAATEALLDRLRRARDLIATPAGEPLPKRAPVREPIPLPRKPVLPPRRAAAPEPAPRPTKADAEQVGRERRASVLKALKAGPMSRPDLEAATGLTQSQLRDTLRPLVANQTVVRQGETRNSRYLLWDHVKHPPGGGAPPPVERPPAAVA